MKTNQILMLVVAAIALVGIGWFLGSRQQSEEAASEPPAPVEEVAREATFIIGTNEEFPEEIAEKIAEFQPLLDYLVSQLGAQGITKGEVLIAQTPAEMAQRLRQGEVDIYLESSFPTQIVTKLGAAELFLVQWEDGQDRYDSTIFVVRGSGITTLDDLKGKKVIFTHPFSTSSYFLPKAELISQGYKLVEISGSDAPVGADEIGYYFLDKPELYEDVLSGAAAAAGGQQEDFEEFLEEAGESLDKFQIILPTRRIHRSLVAVRRDINPELKQTIKKIMLEMHNTPEGQATLKVFKDTTKFAEFEPDDPAFGKFLELSEILEDEIIRR